MRENWRDLSDERELQADRVSQVRRVKALEAQVEQLSRSQVRNPLYGNYDSIPTSKGTTSAEAGSLVPTGASDANRDSWLALDDVNSPPYFTLFDCVLSYNAMISLFDCFSEGYLVHCPFLGQVTSFGQLEKESKLLLWTIAMLGARYHLTYYDQYLAIQAAHFRLYGHKLCEAVEHPLDLQALLLLCTWPAAVDSQWKDPSWMLIGAAISCARQMGLDKPKDEVFFGTRRANNQLGRFPPRLLQLTWLRCFALDVQMSLWHGNLPTLAAARYYRAVTDFCRDPSIPKDYALQMELHVRTSRFLLQIDESLVPPQLAWTVATTFAQDLADLKRDHAQDWTPEVDLVADTAQMYICMASHVQIESRHTDGMDNITAAYAKELIQLAVSPAIQCTEYMWELYSQRASQCPSFRKDSTPLPGCPKHHSRMLFYAATVLLQYLDSEKIMRHPRLHAVRNAFQKAHLMFNSCPLSREHVNAGRSLDVAGRAIGRHQGHLKSNVTTRMGASSMYNLTWLSSLLRGRDSDEDYGLPPRVMQQDGQSVAELTNSIDMSIDPLVIPTTQLSQWNDWDASSIAMPADELGFPFGIWDEALYQDWLNTSATFGIEDWNAAYPSGSAG
ncbi:hypothetical protein B0A48_15512 [Cryoendolithus antarcticus]|uniref:Xylanolytic transcriptional activator regulatory domain-containing protein n=1 Tax=Cryoendolithus antarcticus TaxID=1507870 RepID=A0A1V8SGH6_9PEZI|nr:hypothetical protein B0A48_15512 [Cryoendolithus antarcticus]